MTSPPRKMRLKGKDPKQEARAEDAAAPVVETTSIQKPEYIEVRISRFEYINITGSGSLLYVLDRLRAAGIPAAISGYTLLSVTGRIEYYYDALRNETVYLWRNDG